MSLRDLSLRARLVTAIALLVATTLILSWIVAGRAVLHPLAREVFRKYLDQSVYIARQVERGRDPEVLAEEMGVEIHGMVTELPATREPLLTRHHRGHLVAFSPRRRNLVAVRIRRGWVVVERELDLERPQRRIGLFMLVVAGGVIGAAAWASVVATRPLKQAKEAMDRVSAGELDLRLEEVGPPELRQMAHAFNRMTGQVDGMLRREKELMAGISHELRTPLARLRLELELLRDLGQASPQRLDGMEGDLAEMDALIGELLTISRLELGGDRLERAPLGLDEIAREAAERHPLPQRGLSVVGEGEEVLGDRRLLVRAVGNLLSNAERYTPPGTPVRVEVEGRRLTVSDEGPGVPPEQLDRLFEPFYRGEGSRSKQTGGLGLGLMIVRRVVDAHGGSLSARSEPGEGLSVSLELPPPDEA